jgi:hypothetical protein
MEQIPWETHSLSVSQEIPRVLWNPKVQFCEHGDELLVSIKAVILLRSWNRRLLSTTLNHGVSEWVSEWVSSSLDSFSEVLPAAYAV